MALYTRSGSGSMVSVTSRVATVSVETFNGRTSLQAMMALYHKAAARAARIRENAGPGGMAPRTSLVVKAEDGI